MTPLDRLLPSILLVMTASGIANAANQPVTAIVDTIRSLLTQQPVGGDIWIALAWCAGILAAAYLVAVAVYRRKVA